MTLQSKLIPIAISSQFDKSGIERIHVAQSNVAGILARGAYTRYLTSKPYGMVSEESLSVGFGIESFEYRTMIQEMDAEPENLALTFTVPSWSFRNQVQTASSSENIGVAFSVPTWSFRNVVVPASASQNVGVTFSVPAWQLKLHPSASSSENVGATFTIQGFTIA